jgi:hypothetical protein
MFGLNVLTPGFNPIVDVVVLHGLDGHPTRSFTATVDGVDICWLTHPDLLPASLPRARILTFGYDVKTKAKVISMAKLEDHADHLLQNLERLRLDTQVFYQHLAERLGLMSIRSHKRGLLFSWLTV